MNHRGHREKRKKERTQRKKREKDIEKKPRRWRDPAC